MFRRQPPCLRGGFETNLIISYDEMNRIYAISTLVRIHFINQIVLRYYENLFTKTTFSNTNNVFRFLKRDLLSVGGGKLRQLVLEKHVTQIFNML